jgi:4-amino-4-deoxy-L-arabinose transferase-like glycosyltransferase
MQAADKQIAESRLLNKIVLIVIFTLALVLIPISTLISIHGSINFDEAFLLQAPTSMVKQGTYSTTYDGGQNFDPGFSTGPTVLLPIGLIFKVFGIGIVQARLVILVYFFLTIIITFHISKTLYGSISAVISLFLILCLPEMFFFALKVLGEIPTIFFFMTACWLLIKQRAFSSGILMGLAILTKLIFILIVPAIVLLFLFELAFSTNHRKKVIIFYSKVISGLLLPNLIWELAKYISLGQSGYEQYLGGFLSLFKTVSGSQEVFFLPTILTRINVFASPFPFIPPLLVFTLFTAALILNLFSISSLIKVEKVNNLNRVRLFLSLYSFVYLAWWMFGKHLDTWRYLFPGYIILIVVMGSIFTALLGRIGILISTSTRIGNLPLTIRNAMSIGIIIAFSIPLFVEPARAQSLRIKSLLSDSSLSTQYQIAGEISRIEKTGGRIAYWGFWQSPEISFLSQSRFNDLFRFETKQELDEMVFNGKNVYVLISPTQSQISPEAWDSEKVYCGELALEMNGYQLFEYVPTYDKMYRDYIAQENIASLPNTYPPTGPDLSGDYQSRGFYNDGWTSRRASLWLNNASGYNTLVVEGITNLDLIKKHSNSVKVYVMGILMGEENINKSNHFRWEFKLPAWTKSFKALRIDFESNKVFTAEAPGSGGEQREVSIFISRIELR